MQPVGFIGSSQRKSCSFNTILANCGKRNCSQTLSFSFRWLFRQENQKLKELVTGGAGAAASAVVPSDTDAPEAKEEPAKEESAAVRPKMEATTPQRVILMKLHEYVSF